MKKLNLVIFVDFKNKKIKRIINTKKIKTEKKEASHEKIK